MSSVEGIHIGTPVIVLGRTLDLLRRIWRYRTGYKDGTTKTVQNSEKVSTNHRGLVTEKSRTLENFVRKGENSRQAAFEMVDVDCII